MQIHYRVSDAESLTSAEMKNWSNDAEAETCQEIYDVTIGITFEAARALYM